MLCCCSHTCFAVLQQQWQLHERCVHAEYRLDWQKVQNGKKALQAFVVHCEDHHPNHFMAFCPQFYFACVSRTWMNPLVFQELNTDAESLKARVFQQIPKNLRSKYPWGVRQFASRLRATQTEKDVPEWTHHCLLSAFTVRKLPQLQPTRFNSC